MLGIDVVGTIVTVAKCDLQCPDLASSQRVQLVTATAASGQVERLLRRLQRDELLEPLELAGTVWLVQAIVVLDQRSVGPTGDSRTQVFRTKQSRLEL
jgi:hypothetical protein